MEFVTRLGRGERMAELCREYEISRKTGYKIWNRFKEDGVWGLPDASRRPLRSPRKTPQEIEDLLVALRKDHPTWGAKKIGGLLRAQRPDLKIPARSTIDLMFSRHGLTKPRRRRNLTPRYPKSLHKAEAPNEVMCIDFKGQFRLGNNRYCYPFTATDQFSRMILSITALDTTCGGGVREAMQDLFCEHGLPQRIRSDNGSPFASRGLLGLSKLSVWWRLLGIKHERITPGCPQENGRHERMHRTLKEETTRPARGNSLAQQECFDVFVHEFNTVRPHEGIDMKRPADIHRTSPDRYPDTMPEPEYPLHDDVRKVTAGGHLHFHGRKHKCFLGSALEGQRVGIREEKEGVWLVSFTDLDLGHYHFQTRKFEPLTP
jgi:transposase InsO family protein